MELSFNNVNEWRKARKRERRITGSSSSPTEISNRRWQSPPSGKIKINVDASVFSQAETFAIGMVACDHRGEFIEAKVMDLPCRDTVLEAECIGVKEVLYWAIHRGYTDTIIETDSLLTVRALLGKKNYLIEVGHVVDHCKHLLQSDVNLMVSHVRKQANKVAHNLARFPCLVNCFHVFTSPPTQLLETIMIDFSNE